jgi:hypothetical protein
MKRRHDDIEEMDNVSDVRGPDCPACADPLGLSNDRHRCKKKRAR